MRKIPGAEKMMAALFMSEAKARIYLYLTFHGESFAADIARGTNLHPSTIREALSEMTGDGQLFKEAVDKDGKAGRTPSKYSPAPMREILHKYMGRLENGLKELAKVAHNG